MASAASLSELGRSGVLEGNMSIKLMSQVWELDLDHGLQSIMLALADHADDDGSRVFPSIAYVAWKTGYSPNQARRIMHDLTERGILIAVAHQEGGRGLATEYRLDLGKATKKVAFIKTPILERLPSGTIKTPIQDLKATIAMVAQPSEPPIESPDTYTPSLSPQLLPEEYPAWAEGFSRIEGLAPKILADLVRVGKLPAEEPDIGCVLAFVDHWSNRPPGKRKSVVAGWRNWLKNEHKVLPFSDSPKREPLRPGMVYAGDP